jgi:hypothetical protein
VFDESEDALAAVDWKEVGTSLHAMLPLMGRFIDGVRAGKEIAQIPEIGPIQKHNGALVDAALRLKTGKVPGRDVNGTYTHPHPQANAIAATLEAAGMPLAEDQAKALERVATEHGEADARRRAGYDERTPALRQILEEAEARERFFEAAFAVLTAAQRDVLKPAAVKDLLHADLFSSGLVWAQYARPMPAVDRPGLVAAMQQVVLSSFAIPEARFADAKALVEQWAPTPPAASPGPAAFTMTVPKVRDAAVSELELLEGILRMGLGADVEKKVLAYGVVHVPTGPGGE